MIGGLSDDVVAVLMACALAGLTTAVVLSNYRAFPALLRPRSSRVVGSVVLLAAVAGGVVGGGATGTLLWDTFVSAGICAAVTQLAANSDRRALAFAAAVAMLVAPDAPAVGIALGLALGVQMLAVRLTLLKAIAGAVMAVAVAGDLWDHPGPRPLVALLVVTATLSWSARARSGHEGRRQGALVGIVVAVLVTVASAGFVVSGLAARGPVRRGIDHARVGLDLARSGDAQGAVRRLEVAAAEFRLARARLSSWPARMADAMPGVAQNAAALRTMTAVGDALSTAAAQAAVDGDPDRLRLQDGVIDLAQVDIVAERVEQVVGALDDGRQRLARSDSAWLAPPVRGASDDLVGRIDSAIGPARRAREVLRSLPGLFGAAGPRRWFVAIQTPAESRAAGGVIGNYAVLRADRGRLTLERTGRDTDLNAGGDPKSRVISGPREYLDRYERFGPSATWQNVNLSPDFPTVAGVIEGLYPQSGGTRVDGVIGVDPAALAALLRLTGPVRVPAWPDEISADNAEQILLHDQYIVFQNPDRIDFLAQVTRAVFDRMTAGASPEVPRLAAALAPILRGRHLQLHAADHTEQRLFEDFGAAGAMPPVVSDSLAVVTQNSSGNKIDWFLRRTADYQVVYDPASSMVRSTLDVRLENQAPARGLPPYVIGSIGGQATDPGENRVYLSVYTPLELVGASVAGVPLAMEPQRELGRNVYSAFVIVPPASTLGVRLSLRGAVPAGGYRLDVRRQPLSFPDVLAVRVASPRTAPVLPVTGLRADGAGAFHRGPATEDETFEVTVGPTAARGRP